MDTLVFKFLGRILMANQTTCNQQTQENQLEVRPCTFAVPLADDLLERQLPPGNHQS